MTMTLRRDARFVSHDAVDAWLVSWGSRKERKVPPGRSGDSIRQFENLKAVRAHIARHNPSAVADGARRLRDAVKILGDYPAAQRAGCVPNTRELVVVGTPYILPYHESVEILRMLHGTQQWPAS
jgi:toxin ParE1/3/4